MPLFFNETPILKKKKKKKNQGSTVCDQLSILRSPSGPRVSVLRAIGGNIAAFRISAEVPVIAGCPQCES